MARKRMSYIIIVAAAAALVFLGWKMFSRGAYESAPYKVLKSEGAVELREYPDLNLVVTEMQQGWQGNDGSFMRLFRYISGDNEEQQKVAMTTPVFMEREKEKSGGQMGFVVPEKFEPDEIPKPTSGTVQVRKRPGGRFAVIRFSGQIGQTVVENQLARLQEWIDRNGLVSVGGYEVAGYDAPWTPGPFRRNEILIRVEDR
jgi:hypothetical protein